MNTSQRRGWLVVGGIAAVATVAAVVLSVVTGSEADTPSGPPDVAAPANPATVDDKAGAQLVRTVEQYYAALRAGDAAKALSFGPAVSDRRLLTDAALRAQQAVGRIEKVRVDPDVVTVAKFALVDVAITVGGKSYDDTIRVPRTNGRFQLPVAAELTSDTTPYLLFGTVIAPGTRAHVFPGAVRTSAPNPYVTVSGGAEVVAAPGSSGVFIDREFRINATGTTAIRSAVQRAMVACAASRTLTAPDCPNSVISTAGTLVPNSVRWSAPTDFTGIMLRDTVDFGFDEVRVRGTLRFGVSYQIKNGAAARTVRASVLADLYGDVDLTTSPPTYQD